MVKLKDPLSKINQILDYQFNPDDLIPRPQPGKQTEFYNCHADIVLYGGAAGSAKSYGLLLDFAKQEYLANSGYRAAIFRRTYPQLKGPGGLIDDSLKIYKAIDAKAKLTSMPLDWTFSSGARISFRQLQHEKSKHDYQGTQIARIGFDELTHFSSDTFWYMLSRNRSTCGIRPCMRATCNPDAESWVADLIPWYIDKETGYPLQERAGKVRYFIRLDNELIWGDSPDELSRYQITPKSFCFIPASIYDNNKLLSKNPEYLSSLQALHPVEKERLLMGNWKIKLQAGTVFDRTWFQFADYIPEGGQIVRFWDLAATAKEYAKATTFYTAGVKVKKIGTNYYVLDVIYDQRGGGSVAKLIFHTIKQDGFMTKVRWELEGGSAGIILQDEMQEQILNQCPNADAKAIKPLGDKVTRALSPATAAFNGRIFLIRAPWNDAFLNAVQNFDGTPKPLTNDIVDALSGAFKELQGGDHDYSNIGTAQPLNTNFY